MGEPTILLVYIFPQPFPLDFIVVHFGVSLAFFRYDRTLNQTSQGLLSPEQSLSYNGEGRASLPYEQYAIFIALGFVYALATKAGVLLAGGVLIFCLFALPANVMILSITESFWAGLNPLGAVGMVRLIGLPYLGLCGFLFLLSAS